MDEKTQKKKKSRLEKAEISKFQYHFYVPLLMAFGRLRYGLRIDRSAIKGKEGPFLVLGNHTAWVDFFYFAGCIYPRPFNVVVASNIFYSSLLRRMFTSYGAIPKKQFTTDFNCIKQIKRFLDNGVSIMLFPEGRITVDGTTGYISPTIGKLIKWLNYPVVRGITEGSYVTRPKWGNKRPGKVKLKVEQILSKEDIGNMSAQEIADFVIEEFKYNDNRAFVARGSKMFGIHRAEGLQKLLYKCPSCGAEFMNETKFNTMTCTSCGNQVVYGRDGLLHKKTDKDVTYDYIDEWYKYQRDCVTAETEDENYRFVEKVKLLLNNEELKIFTPTGEGRLAIDKDFITYIGTVDGEEKTLQFKLQNHPTVAYKIGQNIEIAEDESIYKFVFEHGLLTTKAVLVIEELNKKYY